MKVCPNCDQRVNPDSIVCKNCGATLKQEKWDVKEVLYYYGRSHVPVGREEDEKASRERMENLVAER